MAVDDHQTANARALKDAGAAVILQERDLSAQSFAEVLASALSSRDALREQAIKSRELAQPDALGRITTVCLEAAGACS